MAYGFKVKILNTQVGMPKGEVYITSHTANYYCISPQREGYRYIKVDRESFSQFLQKGWIEILGPSSDLKEPS